VGLRIKQADRLIRPNYACTQWDKESSKEHNQIPWRSVRRIVPPLSTSTWCAYASITRPTTSMFSPIPSLPLNFRSVYNPVVESNGAAKNVSKRSVLESSSPGAGAGSNSDTTVPTNAFWEFHRTAARVGQLFISYKLGVNAAYR